MILYSLRRCNSENWVAIWIFFVVILLTSTILSITTQPIYQLVTYTFLGKHFRKLQKSEHIIVVHSLMSSEFWQAVHLTHNNSCRISDASHVLKHGLCVCNVSTAKYTDSKVHYEILFHQLDQSFVLLE